MNTKNIETLMHLKAKLSMFCVLSQNGQHFLKNDMTILKKIVKNSKMTLKFE